MAEMSCNLVSKSAIGADSDDKFDGNCDGMMIDELQICYHGQGVVYVLIGIERIFQLLTQEQVCSVSGERTENINSMNFLQKYQS